MLRIVLVQVEQGLPQQFIQAGIVIVYVIVVWHLVMLLFLLIWLSFFHSVHFSIVDNTLLIAPGVYQHTWLFPRTTCLGFSSAVRSAASLPVYRVLLLRMPCAGLPTAYHFLR